MTLDLTCYLVLDEALCQPLSITETAARAAAGGAGLVQLRMKDATTEERVAAGRAVQAAIAGRALFFVNDDVNAAIALDADGVHVGQGDTPPEAVRAQIGASKLLGLSIETPDQACCVDSGVVNYIGAGPVRATATKPGHAAPVGWGGLAQIVAAAPVPAVAIGGLSAADAEAAVRAGAQGLAVVSAICGQPDPEAATRKIARAVAQARKALV
ncbi:MAG: thiamine phosphate synthase [Pseudomonadota bacterium]